MESYLKQNFHDEGIFTIIVTSLGPNRCVLEDLVNSEVKSFIKDMRSWSEQWFSDIRPWKPFDVDSKIFLGLRITCICCHTGGFGSFKL